MINSKRLNKLKKDIKKRYSSIDTHKFIINAKEGLFLFDLTVSNIEDKRRKIEEVLKGVEVYNYSETSIDNLLIVGAPGSRITIIIDDIEDDPEGTQILREYFNAANMLIYSDLTNEQLKEIAAIE